MHYCLVTPHKIHAGHNAGWHMITAGIRYLIRLADNNATFGYVSMFYWPKSHDFSQYDRLVLCGNPRYDGNSKNGQWLYEGLLSKLVSLNIPLIDAWQGAGYALGNEFEDSLKELMSTKRNNNTAKLLKGSKIIARDHLSQAMNEKFGLDSVLLPCSSFWAASEYDIHPKEKTENIAVVYRMGGYSDINEILRELSKTHRIIATSSFDDEWCKSIGVNHELIYDPVDLLNLYSKSIEVISFRLHAAIPAASLGCKVYAPAIDTRAEACSLFDINYGDYREGIKETKAVGNIAAPDLTNILGKES